MNELERIKTICDLLQYLLNQKKLADEWAEEICWKAELAEKKGDEGKARCHRHLLIRREEEIENLKKYIDLVQILHYEMTN